MIKSIKSCIKIEKLNDGEESNFYVAKGEFICVIDNNYNAVSGAFIKVSVNDVVEGGILYLFMDNEMMIGIKVPDIQDIIEYNSEDEKNWEYKYTISGVSLLYDI